MIPTGKSKKTGIVFLYNVLDTWNNVYVMKFATQGELRQAFHAPDLVASYYANNKYKYLRRYLFIVACERKQQIDREPLDAEEYSLSNWELEQEWDEVTAWFRKHVEWVKTDGIRLNGGRRHD